MQEKYDFEADLICTACHHAKRFHVGFDGKECVIVTSDLDCLCVQFSDPRQPVNLDEVKWSPIPPGDYYFYTDPPLNDPVNHPAHYTSHPSGVECIQITEHMSFCLGNAVKYIWRYNEKNGIEDLKKAQWYLNREITRLEDQ